jgi:5-methylcytosine-specific restriction endonuclease McrA
MTWWKNKKYNLTGKKFSRLTVIELVSLNGPRRWKCLCDCGNFTEVSAANLKKKGVVSCGCAAKGCNKKRPYEWLYNSMVRASIPKGKTDISYERFVEFTTVTTCHYCSGPVVWRQHCENNNTKSRSYNLDRKDNSLGYLLNNVVVCCPSCNRTKGDRFNYKQFVKIGEVIKTFAK